MSTELRASVRWLDPAETSSLVNRRTIEEHASEAAFLWTQRQRAVVAPHFKLHHLKRVDHRLQSHLVALRIAQESGWRIAQQSVDPDDAGTVFTLGWLAFSGGVMDHMRDALAVALASPRGIEAMVDALAWLPSAVARDFAIRLCRSSVGSYRLIGCRALSELGEQNVATLETAIHDPEGAVRASALKAIGEAGCVALETAARRALKDQDLTCAYWAAWSLALMGDTVAARTAYDLGLDSNLDPLIARGAIEIAMRCATDEWCRQSIRNLVAQPGQRRLAIVGAGALGDPIVVPWLIEQCEDSLYAPVAGEAISMITGADLSHLDLVRDSDEQGEEDDDDDSPMSAEDSDLPSPDPVLLRGWWKDQGGRFTPGGRYLAGSPVSLETASTVLRTGYQRQRAAAAIELNRLSVPGMMFRTGARADRQYRRLNA
jgi:uncharacterized protein (TIGR02270 family)